jgi:hypothetical protein
MKMTKIDSSMRFGNVFSRENPHIQLFVPTTPASSLGKVGDWSLLGL